MKVLKGRATLEPVLQGDLNTVLQPVPMATDEPLLSDGSKIVKLEQMLEEKNKIVAALQKNLQSSDDHEAEINGLKQIFQSQIEALKQQNRDLRSEAVRLSQENLDLQTKVYAGQPPRLSEPEYMAVEPAALSNSSEMVFKSVIEDSKPQLESAQANSLSLHDVFSEAEEKNS
jgi:DNA repair exonuclease SbcCD ATPase subunit